ncbi:MAG: lipid II flippase MurJ [Candidatus Latescibacterota bacterium]|jgi:O-antigen/teichoic acid export membrane protein
MTTGLTRTAALVALGRASGTASLLAVNAILARAWPVEQVGAWAAVWILGSAVVPLFLLGLPTTVLYLFPRRDAAGRSVLLLQVAGALTLSGLLLALLLPILGPLAMEWLDPRALTEVGDLGALLAPFLPYLFSLVCGGFVDSALVAAGRAGWQAGLSLAHALGLILVAAAGFWLGLEVRAVLLLVSVIGVFRLAIGMIVTRLATGPRPGAERLGQGGRELLACALPIWLTDAVGGLSRYVDRIVVAAFFPAAVLAQYHLAAVEVPVSLLLGAVVTVLVPRISGLHQEGRITEIAELWQQAIGRLALLVLPLFAFLFCFAGPFMAVYLPESYARGSGSSGSSSSLCRSDARSTDRSWSGSVGPTGPRGPASSTWGSTWPWGSAWYTC